MRSILKSVCCTGAAASALFGLYGCGSSSSKPIERDNVRTACMEGGESITNGVYEQDTISSFFDIQLDLLFKNCTSTIVITNERTNQPCTVTVSQDGPLHYSYSYIPSVDGEAFEYRLSLESPAPLRLSFNDQAHKIEFKDFKARGGHDSPKEYSGTIIVDGVEYAADELVPFVESGMVFCP